MVLLALASVLLAGAGAVAVAVHEDDDDRQVAEGPAPDDLTTTTSGLATTTSTTAAAAATTTSSPTTTAGATSTTTPRATTTVRTNTTRPQTTTTAPLELCVAEQIDISAAPESLSYPAGQPVTMRTTLRNRSSTPCFYRGYDVTMRFFDPARRLLTNATAGVPPDVDRTFAPGQTLTHTATWNPANCPAPPCATPPAGIYSVVVSWSFSGGAYGATQDFVLR
jgi:hypothetical protein